MVAMKTGDDALSRLEKSVTAYEQASKVPTAVKKAGLFSGLRGRASPVEKAPIQTEGAPRKESAPKGIEDLVTDMDTAFQAALKDAEEETKTTGKTDKFTQVFAQHERIKKLAAGKAAQAAATTKGVFAAFSKQKVAPHVPQGLTALAAMNPEAAQTKALTTHQQASEEAEGEKVRQQRYAAREKAEKTKAKPLPTPPPQAKPAQESDTVRREAPVAKMEVSKAQKQLEELQRTADETVKTIMGEISKKRAAINDSTPGKSFKLALLDQCAARANAIRAELEKVKADDAEDRGTTLNTQLMEIEDFLTDEEEGFDVCAKGEIEKFEKEAQALLSSAADSEREALQKRINDFQNFKKEDIDLASPQKAYKSAIAKLQREKSRVTAAAAKIEADPISQRCDSILNKLEWIKENDKTKEEISEIKRKVQIVIDDTKNEPPKSMHLMILSVCEQQVDKLYALYKREIPQ